MTPSKPYTPDELKAIADAFEQNHRQSARSLARTIHTFYWEYAVSYTRTYQSIYSAIRRYKAGRNKPCSIHSAF